MNRRVLLVDDVPELLESLKDQVEEVIPSWEIHEASGYAEALGLIKDNRYEVVITDLMLDNENGEQLEGMKLTEYVKRENPACSVAIVTNFLKQFVDSNQSSKYHELNLEFFDRTMKIEIFGEMLRNYLYRVSSQYDVDKKISDLWELACNTKKISYWILLEGGGNTENQFVAEVAMWEKRCGRFQSVVYVTNPMDNYYKILRNKFSIEEFPALVFSNSSSMKEYGVLKSSGIRKLGEIEQGLFKTMTKIHILLEQRESIKSVERMLQGKEFWDFGAQIFKKLSLKEFLELLIKLPTA